MKKNLYQEHNTKYATLVLEPFLHKYVIYDSAKIGMCPIEVWTNIRLVEIIHIYMERTGHPSE